MALSCVGSPAFGLGSERSSTMEANGCAAEPNRYSTCEWRRRTSCYGRLGCRLRNRPGITSVDRFGYDIRGDGWRDYPGGQHGCLHPGSRTDDETALRLVERE